MAERKDEQAAAGEDQRRSALLVLERSSPGAVASYVEYLADPSWRVRKTAVMLVERMRGADGLFAALVAALGEEGNAGLRNASSEALLRLGSEAVPALIAAWPQADGDHRKFIVEALGSLGTPAAPAALAVALEDHDENVRAAAAEALGRVGGEASIAALRRCLAGLHGDVLQTAYLLAALGVAGARLSLEELRPYLQQPSFAREVYVLLAHSGEAGAAPILRAGLSGASRGNRAAAVKALATLERSLGADTRADFLGELRRDATAVAALERALEDDDDTTASSAVYLLGLLRDPARAPMLLHACACRPFVEVGIQAVTAVGAAVVAPLLDAVERVDVESRVLYLEVLESVGDPRVIDTLAPMLPTFDIRSAEAAVRLIGGLGGPGVTQSLLDLADGAERELWRPISLALANLGMRHGETIAADVAATLQARGREPVLLLALGELGRAADIVTLEAASHDQSADVRRAAIEAALPMGERFPEETLILALADEHPAVRGAAARALGAHRSARSRAALIGGAHDGEPWVAAEAVRALGAVGGDEVVATLFDAAGRTSSVIAISALQSLLRCNPAGVEAAVRTGLRHADPEVAREALELTLRLEAPVARELLLGGLQHRFWEIRRAAAELLSSRQLVVEASLVHQRLAQENEPLVRE
ncbi:MAG: HEAT repeat domain-containing protein, partial [Myxococcota bacterium]